jgi:vacuolar protein sorting-associated protein 35
MSYTPPLEDQQKVLNEALKIVKYEAYNMRKSLENDKLMDALKHCSDMLSELRTSFLTPKNYYELYMAIFDEMRHLTRYLYDSHMNKKHHLSDLYELVQYAGSIIPRLYLMITVGSVFMKVSKELLPDNPEPTTTEGESSTGQQNQESVAHDKFVEDIPPVKELMKDMLEMTRGVQHPTRGLFLRYYLSVMTRDYMPFGKDKSQHGNINDSIHFILQNFIEMNKLWVRLQHQGLSREKEKREQERKELRLLVGSNLVRISQLDGVDLEMYKTFILPSILEEVVSCRDVIAQEYLMEVIIQVFHDDFHLHTLNEFLSATAQLNKGVDVKQIVISLIDRFANYAARARDEMASEGENEEGKEISGIPEDVHLFEVFWEQITELIKARPEFSITDIIALLVSLVKLSLNCYPEKLDFVDKVLGYASDNVRMTSNSPGSGELITKKCKGLLLDLLLAPIQTYNKNLLTFLTMPSSSIQTGISDKSISLAGNYTDLLVQQPFTVRRRIAHSVAKTILEASTKYNFVINSIEGVDLFFGELCSVMIREQKDGGLFGLRVSDYEIIKGNFEEDLDWDDVVEEQTIVAKMLKLVHLGSDDEPDLDKEFELLSAARKHIGEGGDIRIRFTLPSIVFASINLANKYINSTEPRDTIEPKLSVLFRFINQTISSLNSARENFDEIDSFTLFGRPSIKIKDGLMSLHDMALRLYLLAAQTADRAGINFENNAYDFYVEAFTIYEENISESKSQFAAISLIVGSLYTATIFSHDNYDTLITKCALHCTKLLKRVDQCRSVVLCSHIFWKPITDNEYNQVDNNNNEIENDTEKENDAFTGFGTDNETHGVYRNGKRVLECLQKALKIADSVMDQTVNIELFIEILERYIWYFQERNEMITVKYLNSLIDLIQTNIKNLDNAVPGFSSLHPESTLPQLSSKNLALNPTSIFDNSTNKFSDVVLKHFQNTLTYIALKKEESSRSGDYLEAKRWGEFVLYK